ncbi:iron-containing alcohol dehydrogenase [Salibacterium aidingense]|uniref:iron-containing alcohol dehydrogenase n=1 Tax=Salibacterium aidingense TaxID=384933 RepID=UPI0004069AC9|nr:iron-containing alcohol dehydrogenase [Salibacterium aidingense]
MNFNYFIPTSVEAGRGIAKNLGETFRSLGAEKIFLVTDKGIREAGLLNVIEKTLRSSSISYEVFDQVIKNPSSESIMKGAAQLKAYGAKHVLAVGGGSSIDTAKGIALMAENEGDILDYEGVNKVGNPGLDLTVIPTTAGTGSEVTASTIVTNTNTQFKAAVISPYLFPHRALLDPLLTLQLPKEITASTGMDALTHAIESYTSKTSNPVSEALAIRAITIISENIEKSYFVADDMTSRENMLIASMLAGAAFSQSRLGNVHAISHTFGGVFDIPHGIANAVLLPYVMRFNLPACPQKMAEIAQALGQAPVGASIFNQAESGIEAVIRLNASLNIPGNISELGIDLKLLPKLVEDSMRSGNIHVNPRKTSSEDIETIIKKAYNERLE